MRWSTGTLWILTVLLAATAAFAQSAGADKSDTDVEAIKLTMSKEVGYLTYEETIGRVQVLVGGQLATLEETQKYIPFQIAVAVAGKGPQLEISPTHFQLHDAYGQVHETVPVDEVVKTGLTQFVNEWVGGNPLNVGSRFVTYQRVESNFYPTTPPGLSPVYIKRDDYIMDVIYFPAPQDLHGELMLSFWTKGMTEGAINVRFKAPERKKKHKKKDED